MSPRHDATVLVAGAGPAGCAAATRLAAAGHEVLVLERESAAPSPDMTSGEVLAPVTQHELRDLGVAIEGGWVLDRFDNVRNVYPDLSWTLHQIPEALAYVHVDRGGLNAALRARAQAAGARIEPNAQVTGVELHASGVALTTRDGRCFSGEMLIDAGGRHAPSLVHLKLKQPDPEFRQIAVALFFSSFDGTPPHTWDRHLYGHHGAMISGSRIRPGLYRYILEADLDDKQAQSMKPVEFYEYVARTNDPWLYDRICRDPRAGDAWTMAPLAFRAAEVVRDRLVLVGDAAGYLSPVTGQGMEVALRSARLAAQAADAAIRARDYSAAAFAGYVAGRAAEVAGIVENVRRMLRFLRDRDALLRAARDDAYRAEMLLPLPVIARGTLRDEVTA